MSALRKLAIQEAYLPSLPPQRRHIFVPRAPAIVIPKREVIDPRAMRRHFLLKGSVATAVLGGSVSGTSTTSLTSSTCAIETSTIIVACSSVTGLSRTWNSCVVGGVTATRYANNPGLRSTAIFVAVGVSGTTVTITATASASMSGASFVWWSVDKLISAVPQDQQAASAVSGGIALTCASTTTGIGVCAWASANSGSGSLSNATNDFQVGGTVERLMGSITLISGSTWVPTVSKTGSSNAMSACSWI